MVCEPQTVAAHNRVRSLRDSKLAAKPENVRSDIPAKLAYVRHLIEVEGFDDARITKKPADITARRGDQLYYFEIKYTARAPLILAPRR